MGGSIDREFLEKLIMKAVMVDKEFLVTLSTNFLPEYFNDSILGEVYGVATRYLEQYNDTPQESIILNSVREESRSDVGELLRELSSIDYDVPRNYDHLMTETNVYLKEQAMKKAILDSVDIIDSGGSFEEIMSKVENALSKDLKIDLGLNYFGTIKERLRRIFQRSEVRVPTGFPEFDEFISGGFPPYTLSVILAVIHGQKSNTLANFAARQVLMGEIPVLFTMEMSEDMFAQRFDSILTGLDINNMYVIPERREELKDRLLSFEALQDRGQLFIKEFPTGDASVRDFRTYMRELYIRGIKPTIVYSDYIQIMKSMYTDKSNLYSSGKSITEELRAFGREFNIPIVSVSQLNREGGFVGFEELSMNYVAESIGISATSDAMFIYGTDESSVIYESEVSYKVVKNRLGGRVGEVGKFYVDPRSLKMYDSTELDLWIQHAKDRGEDRELAQRERIVRQRGRR